MAGAPRSRWLPTLLRRTAGLLLAVVTAATLSSVIQTLRVHAALAEMGAQLDFSTRLSAIGHDLLSFAPVYAAIVAAGFVIAFAVTGLIRRRARGVGRWLHALAGAVAMLTALLFLEAVLGMSIIAGARGGWGLALFCLAGGVGGAVFARFARPAR